MHKTSLILFAGLLGALNPTLPVAWAAVDEQVVAPIDPSFKYVVSPHGVHLAAVVRKGSKWAVTVDGVAGPRIDEVVTPAAVYVDPRPTTALATGPAAGRHATDQTTAQPITFSKDGAHFAYLARIGEEWVLFEDHKEVVRMPAGGLVGGTVGIAGNAGNTDVRLQFVGDHGEHLLMAKSGYAGFELWVDGQKWPGTFNDVGSGLDCGDPLVSPDGSHIAYPAQIDREHRALVVDGQVAGYYAEKLAYTSDSQHLVSEARGSKGGTALLKDGKPLFTARELVTYYCAPVTNRIAAVLVHRYPDGSLGQFLVVDDKPVEATLCKNGIQKVVFSPDGQHYAAVCSQAPNLLFVVIDGKKGENYDQLGVPSWTAANGGLAFSPDSSRLVYVAHGAGKYLLVVNGEESDDAFDNITGFLFSADGKHVVYCGSQMGSNNVHLVIDGKTVTSERGLTLDQFDFSPDGSRFAYAAAGNYGGPMHIDGQGTPLVSQNFAFSPDGKHIAVSGSQASDNVAGLWVDGQQVYKGERNPEDLTFSNDSQHLYWCVQEPDPTRTNGNYYVLVTYADGKPVARADAFSNLSRILVKPVGYKENTVHPGWQAVGDSGLTLVAPVADGEIKRYVVTPTDTNLDTLLAATKSGPIHL